MVEVRCDHCGGCQGEGFLLGSADRARWSSQGWWWPAVIAALAPVVLLTLWWLLAQLRQRHPGALPVGGTPPQEGVELRDHPLSDAITTKPVPCRELSTRPYASPAGLPPRTRVGLTLTSQAAPGTVLDVLCEGPLRTVRRSTGSPGMPTEVRLQVAGHKPHRAE
ncbi:alkaline shock response membrane anchor protein AmaP [Streptomyces sp. NBC_01483]|uniref:alkaline shock response membrane anchor protein AmaP n=1 Tax=Streptomyces sp. NBC_01483 TaxID=2903883 RepID=UPI002E34A28B|nr:alkaline shock response membrane anchor protein AmaP [Streptomyces sp. NBC_01483]